MHDLPLWRARSTTAACTVYHCSAHDLPLQRARSTTAACTIYHCSMHDYRLQYTDQLSQCICFSMSPKISRFLKLKIQGALKLWHNHYLGMQCDSALRRTLHYKSNITLSTVCNLSYLGVVVTYRRACRMINEIFKKFLAYKDRSHSPGPILVFWHYHQDAALYSVHSTNSGYHRSGSKLCTMWQWLQDLLYRADCR